MVRFLSLSQQGCSFSVILFKWVQSDNWPTCNSLLLGLASVYAKDLTELLGKCLCLLPWTHCKEWLVQPPPHPHSPLLPGHLSPTVSFKLTWWKFSGYRSGGEKRLSCHSKVCFWCGTRWPTMSQQESSPHPFQAQKPTCWLLVP